MHFAELIISLGELYQCDWKKKWHPKETAKNINTLNESYYYLSSSWVLSKNLVNDCKKMKWKLNNNYNNRLFEGVQSIRRNKIERENYEKLESGTDNRKKERSWCQNQASYFQRKCAITITICDCNDIT